jgi:4-hydroxybenzoate polyprenyltransferase
MNPGLATSGSIPPRERLSRYADLIRLDRPIGVFLLLWPALWALWIAGDGRPDWLVVAVFVVGTFLMRSAGCAINDYADRNFDGHVARTCRRPVASGRVSPREALGVFMVLSVLAFGLVLLLNVKTILLSVPAVALAATYPFMKRYTHFPQVVLGAAFGWAVPMAFMALQNRVPVEAWVLFAATVVWTVVYDTMYAMVDREDDLKVGIKSTAIAFGSGDRLVVGVLQFVMSAMLVWVGLRADRGALYFAGLAVTGGLFLYQQYLIRERDPGSCFRAFLNNNFVGMSVFTGLAVDYLVFP